MDYTEHFKDIVETKYGTFIVGPRDGVCNHIAKGAFWDSWLLPHISNFGPNDVAVDVGSHIGQISVYLAQRCLHVHSFEPQLINCNRLVKNVELNNLKNVTCYNVALYNKETKMSVNGRGDQDKIVYDGGQVQACCMSLGENPAGDIEAKTLDSYGLTGINFIKIDCEGAEEAVLEGSIETIKRCRPTIIFEWAEKSERYNNFFRTINYTVKEIVGQNYLATPK